MLALRWAHVDLAAGMLTVCRNYVRLGGRGIEKDTMTHQLDTVTVEIMAEHRQRYEELRGSCRSSRASRPTCSRTGRRTTCRATRVR